MTFEADSTFGSEGWAGLVVMTPSMEPTKTKMLAEALKNMTKTSNIARQELAHYLKPFCTEKA